MWSWQLSELQCNQQRWKVQKMWIFSAVTGSDSGVREETLPQWSHYRISSCELCRDSANCFCRWWNVLFSTGLFFFSQKQRRHELEHVVIETQKKKWRWFDFCLNTNEGPRTAEWAGWSAVRRNAVTFCTNIHRLWKRNYFFLRWSNDLKPSEPQRGRNIWFPLKCLNRRTRAEWQEFPFNIAPKLNCSCIVKASWASSVGSTGIVHL